MRSLDPLVSPSVYLVDDEPGVLTAIARLLRSHGWSVHTYDSPQAFLAELAPAAVGCAVVDLAMPEIDGLALQTILSERDSLLGIVFLTGQGSLNSGVKAMKSGAVDFLTKPVGEAQLVSAVSSAVARSVAAGAAAHGRKELLARMAALTPREHEVMRWVATGALNKQIAAELGTVEKTVKVHRARVMEKLRVRSVAELVRLVDRAGVVDSNGAKAK